MGWRGPSGPRQQLLELERLGRGGAVQVRLWHGLGAGEDRPDLARAVSASDFDGQSDVRVEQASMMPMPMAFRMYLLDNWLQTGVIDLNCYANTSSDF